MQTKNIYQDKEPQYNVKAIMAVLLFGGFLSLFNETILNVAFPKLMEDMSVTAPTVQWLTTGYMLVVGILVPVTAFLIHSFTTKQLFISAMTLFLAGTFLAILSTTFPALLISRMIQATGTGMLVPIMMNTVLVINPPEKRGSAMGLCVCAILFGPALGPIASGALLQFFSWHSLFIILVPLSLASMIFGGVYLENASVITKPQIDFPSILLSTIGFAGIIYGISILGDSTQGILKIIVIFTIGIISLLFFTRRQLALKQPMLEIRAFKHPLFTISVFLLLLIQMVQFSMNIVLPILLQNGLKTSTLTSALVLLPAVLLNGFMTPVSGKLFDKIGGKTLIPIGLLIMCGSIFLLSRITTSTPIISITLLYCLVCIGIAMSMSPSQTNALNQLPMKNQADGIAITNTILQIAAAIGTPLFIGLMTKGQNSYLGNKLHTDHIKAVYSGFSYSLSFAAGIIAIGFILSLTLRKKAKVN